MMGGKHLFRDCIPFTRLKPERRNMMNNKFANWLISNDNAPCFFEENGWTYILIRVEKDENFDYLFDQIMTYGEKDLARHQSFDYAGIYCKKDGLIYDAEYVLIHLEHDPSELSALKARSAKALGEQLSSAVQKKVKAIIGNNRSNLQITELTDKNLLQRLEYGRKYDAMEVARRNYLATENPESKSFVISPIIRDISLEGDSLLAYILDPEGYVRREAKKFITKNQQELLFEILKNEAIEKEYRAILASRKNPVHIIKKIMTAMKEAGDYVKTVKVTIRKDNTEFTFQTDADVLRADCANRTWAIVAGDRRKFEKIFGRNAEYTPEEIVRITYKKKILYEIDRKEK